MVSLIDRLLPRGGAVERPVAPPADEAAAAEASAKLEDARTALAQRRGERDQARSELMELRTARFLGEAVDQQRYGVLLDRVEALAREILESEDVVAGLAGKVQAWNAQDAERRHAETVAALEEIAAAAPALEARYLALASELVDVAKAMNRGVTRFEGLEGDLRVLQTYYGLPLPRLRRPYRPFVPPETYLRSGADQYVTFERWVADWRARHAGFGEETAP